MKLTKKTNNGIVQITDEKGGLVAEFGTDYNGAAAYQCMKNGLVHYPNATLFDEDVGLMMVGDVSDLTLETN